MESPLNHFMQQLLSQELPFVDSVGRARITELLRAHQEAGLPVITSQEQLPAEIREIMDL